MRDINLMAVDFWTIIIDDALLVEVIRLLGSLHIIDYSLRVKGSILFFFLEGWILLEGCVVV